MSSLKSKVTPDAFGYFSKIFNPHLPVPPPASKNLKLLNY
jgi:hypothetical protein